MKKYLTIFSLSFQNEFIYRFNFILWRLRNVLRILMVITLWSVVFASRDSAFGYSESQLITYVFMASIVQTIIISSPSSDSIGGEIANGDLSNYLLKPLSYIRYWFIRDLASKLLNIIFAICELGILLLIFRPDFHLPANYGFVLLALLSLSLGVVLYFFISKIMAFTAFWTPENTWGPMFFLLVLMETLSGVIFPLDVLPKLVRVVFDLTPFPYLVYYPLGIFVGRFTGVEVLSILVRTMAWIVISYLMVKKVWRAGLKVYSAVGR